MNLPLKQQILYFNFLFFKTEACIALNILILCDMYGSLYLWYILAIDADAASLNVVETEDESNDGALSRAWLSHLEGSTQNDTVIIFTLHKSNHKQADCAC